MNNAIIKKQTKGVGMIENDAVGDGFSLITILLALTNGLTEPSVVIVAFSKA